MALLLTSSTASWNRLCLRSPLAGSTHYCHNYFTSIRQHFELTTVCRASQLICNPVPTSKSARYMRYCDTRVMPAVVSLSNVEDQVGACVHLSKTPGPAVNDEQLRVREKERESERFRHSTMHECGAGTGRQQTSAILEVFSPTLYGRLWLFD